jgi:hypothetical protein
VDQSTNYQNQTRTLCFCKDRRSDRQRAAAATEAIAAHDAQVARHRLVNSGLDEPTVLSSDRRDF